MKILVILLLLIGVSILSPVYGQEVDPNAKKMFQKACDAGEDPSCFNLGTLSYKEGRQKRAIKYYKKACKMGNQGGCAKEQKLSR